MEIIKKISLAFKDDTSDKVYFAYLVKETDGFLVNFEFGRRDTKLQFGTKTQSPVEENKALEIFNKIIKEKKAKGYYEE